MAASQCAFTLCISFVSTAMMRRRISSSGKWSLLCSLMRGSRVTGSPTYTQISWPILGKVVLNGYTLSIPDKKGESGEQAVQQLGPTLVAL